MQGYEYMFTPLVCGFRAPVHPIWTQCAYDARVGSGLSSRLPLQGTLLTTLPRVGSNRAECKYRI